MTGKYVPVSAAGQVLGEANPGAVLSDHEVDLMRDLHERHGWGYRRLARKFEVGKTTVRRICNYQKRAQAPTRHRVVPPSQR